MQETNPNLFDGVSETEGQSKKPVMPIEMVARSHAEHERSKSATAEAPAAEEKNAAADDDKPKKYLTSECLHIESEKQDAGMLYLFSRGMFYRAYNGSAWLIHCIYKNTYKVLRDNSKANGTFMYLGFPKQALTDVIGDDAEITEQDEGHVCIRVRSELLGAIPEYDTWLKTVKIRDKEETDLPEESTPRKAAADLRISNAQEIATRLSLYHIERHTMIENVQYLSDLIDSIKYD